MKFATHTALLIIAVPLRALAAGDAGSSANFEIPRKYDVARYMAGWERNPFSTPTPPAAPPPVESPLKDFAYTSVYGPRDTPSFTIVNTRTSERFRLSLDTPGDNGLKLKSFTLGSSRKGAKLEVELGSETGTLEYASDYVKQGGGAAGARPGGLPGQPGMPPGIQRPGMPAGLPVPRVGAPTPAVTQQQNRSIAVPAPSAPTVVGSAAGSNGGNGRTPTVYGAPTGAGSATPAPAVLAPVIAPVTQAGGAAGGNGAVTVGAPVVNPPVNTAPGAPRRRQLIPSQ